MIMIMILSMIVVLHMFLVLTVVIIRNFTQLFFLVLPLLFFLLRTMIMLTIANISALPFLLFFSSLSRGRVAVGFMKRPNGLRRSFDTRVVL